MKKNIAVIPGDGIGPEIIAQAVRVLSAVAKRYGHEFVYTQVTVGGSAIDQFGMPLPEKELHKCLSSDSVLLGAVGGPKWESLPGHNRPEKALLGIRSAMQLYCNLRPATLFSQLGHACPLREDIAEEGIDFIVVRELTGGIYFGEHKTETKDGQQVATDVMQYSEFEIERIAKRAFELALTRRKKVTSVDKSNVLDCSRLWRATVNKVAQSYPDVECSHMYVDNAAMQIVRKPSQFDVIVTENMFGDILSDEASMITGSIGMIPSCSMGEGTRGMYEPIHGSAPDIAGKNIANPIGTILSAAMMLEYSFGLTHESRLIHSAVDKALKSGLRTLDIMSKGTTSVSCSEMGDAILSYI
jgi:3-isopropylmalate dehydrogenase